MQSEWESKLTPSACYWEAKNFDDVLENSLYCPYSLTEWDSIFAALINLLGDRNYRIRQQAIDCLKIALESERSQFSIEPDYTPKSIEERMRPIFEAIVSQSAITPEILDYFCYEFQHLAKKAPYHNLIIQWLNELALTEKRQAAFYEAILTARILFYRNLNSLAETVNYDFKAAVDRIDGFLLGLSTLCHGLNYVPIYTAMVCPQLTNNIAVDIQAQILVKSAEYEFKDGTECLGFQLVDDWETALGDSVDRWIFQRLFNKDKNIRSYKDLDFVKERTSYKLLLLIRNIFEPEKPEVWSFQIALGCHYNWGFDNEAYAFKTRDKLFIVTLGWAD